MFKNILMLNKKTFYKMKDTSDNGRTIGLFIVIIELFIPTILFQLLIERIKCQALFM